MKGGCSGCLLVLLGFVLGILATIMVLSVLALEEDGLFEKPEIEQVREPEKVSVPMVENAAPKSVNEPKTTTAKKVTKRAEPQQEKQVGIRKATTLGQLETALATMGMKIGEVDLPKQSQTKTAVKTEIENVAQTGTPTEQPRQGGFNILRRDGKSVVLYLGMSKADVIRLLGEPESFRTMSYVNGEELEYVTGNNKYSGIVTDLTLEFRNGELIEITKN